MRFCKYPWWVIILSILYLFPGAIWSSSSVFALQSDQSVVETEASLNTYFRGIALYRSGKWDEAASLFDELLRKDPEFSLASGYAGDAYRKLHQPEKARMYYALAAALCEEHLQRKAQWAPDVNDIAVLRKLLYYRFRLGEVDKGLTLLTSLSSQTREKLAGERAMLLFAQENIAETLKELCRALQNDPLDVRLTEFVTELREAGHKFHCPAMKVREKPTRSHAFIIGISKYQDRGIPSLDYPVHDSLCMYRALRNPRYSLFPRHNITVLVDEEATAAAIQRELLYLEKQTGDSDLVLISFAGHVARENDNAYWITSDTILERIPSTGLSNPVIAGSISRIPARRVIVFIDSWHNVPAGQGKPERLKNLADYLAVKKDREIVVVTASRGITGQEDLKRVQRGALSPCLCEVFQGKGDGDRDGFVDMGEAWSYLKTHLSSSGGQRTSLTTPTLNGYYSKEFVLAKSPLKK